MMICFESIINVNNKNFFFSVKDVDKQQKVIISIKQNIDWVKIEKIVCKVARDRTQMFVLVREKCKSSSMMTRWKQKMQVSLQIFERKCFDKKKNWMKNYLVEIFENKHYDFQVKIEGREKNLQFKFCIFIFFQKSIWMMCSLYFGCISLIIVACFLSCRWWWWKRPISSTHSPSPTANAIYEKMNSTKNLIDAKAWSIRFDRTHTCITYAGLFHFSWCLMKR